MASDAKIWPQPEAPAAPDSVEMPRPTAAPLVLALGITLLAAGVALGTGFLVVGAVVVVAGLGIWIVQLLPGRGHVHESLVEAARPQPVMAVPGGVEHLRPGMPGYRLRLPQDVHPVSAGLKGGLAGGAVMPVPALLWGLISGHGLWYPVNILAGIVLPAVGKMTVPELEQFNASLLMVALVIHVVMSVVIGLIFGVLLPTLPAVPRPIAWGGLLMPIVWTGASYAAMQVVNPALPGESVGRGSCSRSSSSASRCRPWSWGPNVFQGHSPEWRVAWSAVQPWPCRPSCGRRPAAAASGTRSTCWRGCSCPARATWKGRSWGVSMRNGCSRPALHAVLSTGFGVLFAVVTPQLPPMPGPIAWGGLILPLVWTGTTHGLMGVVNPVLQDRVDWAWFIVSQFVFGVTAAVVVLRSEMVRVPPAGLGPDRVADFVAGEGGGRS